MNVVVKKLFTNTLWPAPMSQSPFAHEKNWVSSASGGFCAVPVPVIGTACGLFAALSVSTKLVERVPLAVGENVIDTLQLVLAGRVRPEQPSSTWVKSSEWVAALLMNRDPLPELVTVIDCGALVVPIACAAKVSDVGANVTAGVPDGGGGGCGAPPPPPPPP